MNARRVSSPPVLPGYEFIELIGSGGYADVFLYQQKSPRRQVAIKIVDNAAFDTRSAVDYTEEANVMAMVSAHPHIVQVFQASVSPDGRPFLVMEYYPRQNFHERARNEQMSVAEVLRVGIQIASAVETAHRAGILHRDIKPANILTSEFNHPGLTDFGIAAVAGQADQSGDGLSIPWSPPEALGEAPTRIQSDVYSLAATIYTMLAGRAPFEVKGGDNRPLAMMTRIERDPVPPVGRDDVPRLLERVLTGAMAKDPSARPATAADLARQLQEVESSMQLPVTPLQLRDNRPIARSRLATSHDDATRVKNVTSVQAQRSIQTQRSPQPSAPSARQESSRDMSGARPSSPSEPTAAPALGVVAAGDPIQHTIADPESPRVSTYAPAAFSPGGSPTTPGETNPSPTDPTGASAADAGDAESGFGAQSVSGLNRVNGSQVDSDRPRRGSLLESDVEDTIRRSEADPAALATYVPPRTIPRLWWILAGVAAAIVVIIGLTRLVGGGNAEQPVSTATSNSADFDPGLPSGVLNADAPGPLPVPEVVGKTVSEGSYKFTWADPGDGATFLVLTDDQALEQELSENEYITSGKCISVRVVARSGLMSDPTRGCAP